MTVLYWIKTNDQSYDGSFIVANASSSFGYRTGLRDGYPYFLMGSDPTPSTPNPLYYREMTCSNIQVNDGKWHHLAFSFDFNKKEMICYVDGKMQTSISVSATIATNIGDVPSFMGSYFPNVPFVGSIDDVQIRRGVIAR
jgi:hypothetical protein